MYACKFSFIDLLEDRACTLSKVVTLGPPYAACACSSKRSNGQERMAREQWPYGISASRQMHPNGKVFEHPSAGKTLLDQQTAHSPTKALNGSSRQASPGVHPGVRADHYRRDAQGNAGKAGIGIQLTQNADGSFVIENVPPGVRECVRRWMYVLCRNACGVWFFLLACWF